MASVGIVVGVPVSVGEGTGRFVSVGEGVSMLGVVVVWLVCVSPASNVWAAAVRIAMVADSVGVTEGISVALGTGVSVSLVGVGVNVRDALTVGVTVPVEVGLNPSPSGSYLYRSTKEMVTIKHKARVRMIHNPYFRENPWGFLSPGGAGGGAGMPGPRTGTGG